jgi:anti-sigma-K factor RskA
MSAAQHMEHSERETLAGEFALGLLEGAELEAATRRLASDAAFAASVANWQRHLHAIDETAPCQPVPTDLWPGIEAALHRETAAPRSAQSQAQSGLMERLWANLSFWRFGAMASAAAALALAVGLAGSTQNGAVQPVLIAVLMSAENEAAAVVNVSADGRAELRPLKGFEVPPGKAIEIWTLWDRSVGPRSIGLISTTRGAKLDLTRLPRQPGQLFEMTLEPATGSPTGRPTGPILTKGNASVPL